jgi:branched-chain amino acid transport system permease protein
VLSYVVAGLVTGGIYAISAMALVLTYNASRVLNFGQAGMAFIIASTFHAIQSQGVSPVLAAAICVLGLAPVMGLFLWLTLFDRLGEASVMVRVACTVGLQVALSGAAVLLFGNDPVYQPRGVIAEPRTMLHVAGVALTSEQLLILGAAALVGLLGAAVLFGTSVGLVARGAVDSRLMTSLTGTNPHLVAAGTWAVGTMLAGLAGILAMPKIGLDSDSFANLVAVSFAAVVIGRLTRLWWAFAGALVIGIAQSVVIPYLPSSGFLARSLTLSMPFLFMVAAILI